MTNLSVKDLTTTQKEAYDAIINGENVFLTGDAGTGKSTVLNLAQKYFEEHDIVPIATAPTGIAAINIEGITLHQLLKLHRSPFASPVSKESEDNIRSFFSHGGILIIDEISMCRMDLFEYLIKALDKIKAKIQIILVGDFYQLPPVVSFQEKDKYLTEFGNNIYPFQSKYWSKLKLKTFVLHEIVRQKGEANKYFSQALNHIRLNDNQMLNAVNYINQQTVSEFDPHATILCGRNKTATKVNNEQLTKVDADLLSFKASHDKNIPKTYYANDELLQFKIGARVISVANLYNKNKELLAANGEIGTIIDIENNDGKINFKAPHSLKHVNSPIKLTVQWDNGIISDVTWHAWEIYNYVKKDSKIVHEELGNYIQMPLKLAYAITIHKSQGQTLSSVNIKNAYGEIFAQGQLYVALSRVRNMSEMHLEVPISAKSLIPNLAVTEFYRSIDPNMPQVHITKNQAIMTLGQTVNKLTPEQILQINQFIKNNY